MVTNCFLILRIPSANVVLELPPLPSWLTLPDPAKNALPPPAAYGPPVETTSSEAAVPKPRPAESVEEHIVITAHAFASPSDIESQDLEGKHLVKRKQAVKARSKSFLQNLMSRQKNSVIDRRYAFLSKLQWCSTTENMRRVVTEFEIDLRATPTWSQLAFRQLLGKNYGLETLLNFLEDSSLNAPEARNLQVLVQWLIKNNAERNVMRSFFKWIEQSTSLGVFSEEEILQVVMVTSRLRLYNGTDSDEMTRSVLITICQGLLKSSIRQIRDLEAHTTGVLLRCISDRPSDVVLQNLGATMIMSSHESQLRTMSDDIALMLQSWILSCPKLPVAEPKTSQPDRMTELFKLLQWLPEDIARLSIVDANMRILCSAPFTSGQAILVENLSVWWSALFKSELYHILDRSVEWEKVKRSLATSNVDVLASYLQAMDDREICLFIMNQWFQIQRMEQGTGRQKPSMEIAEFEALNRAHASTSPFVSMLRMLRFYRVHVSGRTLTRLLALLRELGKPDTIIEVIKYQETIRKRIKAQTIASAVNDDLYANPRQAYQMFDSYPMLSLEQVPALAESMIMNPYLHPITAIYFRRKRQKVAAKSFPTDAHLPARPGSRLRLLQCMCLAYALAPHLPPRLALRKIYECYLTIKRERLGPISSDITQALVQVGIIRPLQDITWVSTIKLRWILGLVREVEGEEVADEVDEVVYEWRGRVVDVIRERQRRESRGPETRLRRAQEKYDRLWLKTSRRVYKPLRSEESRVCG